MTCYTAGVRLTSAIGTHGNGSVSIVNVSKYAKNVLDCRILHTHYENF